MKKSVQINLNRSYYLGGSERENYIITAENKSIIRFEFNSFREGGQYNVRKDHELSELAKIYEGALNSSDKEVNKLIQFVDKYTKYTSRQVTDKYKTRRRKDKDSKAQYYRDKIQFYTSKLNKLLAQKV